MATSEGLTAFFIDFENGYYHLKNTLPDRDDANDVAVEVIQRLRAHVLEKYGETAVSLDAYGDFERIEDNSQGSLYLLGVETHNVLGTEHKNAADMKLCGNPVVHSSGRRSRLHPDHPPS